jgi:hypothetical protein
LFKFWWKWSTRFCNSNERGDPNICHRWHYVLCK